MSSAAAPDLTHAIATLGRAARAAVGDADVRVFRRLRAVGRAAEVLGRACMLLGAGPFAWFAGMALLAYHLAIESQLNHTVMHGAFVGVPGAEDLTPARYESLALPFQSRTWQQAHGIHHASPSLLERDPDTQHPLFRVHRDTPFRPWHALNTFVGAVFVFECWAFDYDRFLKRQGRRAARDRGELAKFARFVLYQHVLFAALAGPRWGAVLAASLVAALVRNLVFVGLQLGSSVGAEVSTRHPHARGPWKRDAWVRFQVETSKNFVLRGLWKTICGGLDRHIEHHLFPDLPPTRLHALSPEVRALCDRARVQYVEYPSVWASLRDSLSYLARLSRP